MLSIFSGFSIGFCFGKNSGILLVRILVMLLRMCSCEWVPSQERFGSTYFSLFRGICGSTGRARASPHVGREVPECDYSAFPAGYTLRLSQFYFVTVQLKQVEYQWLLVGCRLWVVCVVSVIGSNLFSICGKRCSWYWSRWSTSATENHPVWRCCGWWHGKFDCGSTIVPRCCWSQQGLFQRPSLGRFLFCLWCSWSSNLIDIATATKATSNFKFQLVFSGVSLNFLCSYGFMTKSSSLHTRTEGTWE